MAEMRDPHPAYGASRLKYRGRAMHQMLSLTRQTTLFFIFTVTTALGGTDTHADGNVSANANQAGHSLSRIVIKFSPGVMPDHTIEVEVGRGTVEPRIAPVLAFSEAPKIGDAFLSQWKWWRVTRMRRMYPPNPKNPEAEARHGLDRTFILNVPEGTDTAAMAMAFASLSPQIEYAQVDSIGQIAGEIIPNDPGFALQYALHNTGQTGGLIDADMDAPQAWAIHTGNTNSVTIAIVDSGVTPHDEFVNRMVPGMNTDDPDSNVCDGGVRNGEVCCPGNGLCGGGVCQGGSRNGLECCPGGTCVPFTFDHCGPSGHGTHNAGIAAATGNDALV